jgi:prepilin-type N-terminal cleavage/methylation domain-containing protein
LPFAFCTLRFSPARARCRLAAPPDPRRRPARPRGFSLIEVIVAIAILAGSVAVLGEVTRQGMEAARKARDDTYALLRCESKIDEFTSGATLPTQGDSQAFDDTTDWLFSVEFDNTDVEGLIVLRVTVRQNLPEEQIPAQVSLTRWIVDPDIEFTVPTDSSQTGSSGTGTTGAAAPAS